MVVAVPLRWETFLSYEDPQQDILIGLLRLRKMGYAAAPLAVAHGHVPGTTVVYHCDSSACVLLRSALPRSALSCKATSPWCVSCTCTAQPSPSTRATRPSSSTKASACCSWRKLHASPGRSMARTRLPSFLVGGAAIASTPLRHGVRNIALWDWAGVGTRHYYRKMGYEIDGPYMSKSLVPSCTS